MNEVKDRVLLVDDDPALLRVYAKALAVHGWIVETAPDGPHAIALLSHAFDVIVSDIRMPKMSGLAFIRALREWDRDVPVILMTGHPELDSAIEAVECGAFCYLLKPVGPAALADTVHRAMQAHCISRLKREALELVGVERRRLGDRAGLDARFTMARKMLWMAYQPVVSLRGHSIFAYEALLRSYEPTMRTANEVLETAERVGGMCELGRAIRARVSADANALTTRTASTVFVNIDPVELTDDELYSPSSPLARIAGSVVLEITERAALNKIHNLVARVKRLRAMGFRLALGQPGGGSGGAGSPTYFELEPEIVNIDMSLVRDIDSDLRKKRIVRSMIELWGDLGTRVVAKGVETISERDVLANLGCDLLQGHLYGKPQSGFVEPTWGGASWKVAPYTHEHESPRPSSHA